MRRPAPAPIFDVDHIPMPTCPEQASDNLQMLAEVSRRSFLGRGAAAAAVPATVLAASAVAEAAGSGSNSNSVFPSYYTGSTKRNFQEIQRDEASHVDILVAAIRSLGGTPRPYPTFQGINVSNPATFLNLSVSFENTGVHAYFGAAGFIQNPNVLAVAASIAFVEAYHSGFLNTLANQPLIPGGLTYATPFTPAQVNSAVAPFIVSLNDPNNMFPPTFDTSGNKSLANDIAILNFALITEFLEATFYFNSVAKVFGNSN